MSLLRAWWSGSSQGDVEKQSSGEGKDVGDGKEAESEEGATNPWVKGFGGECLVNFLLLGHVLCSFRHCV